MPALLKIQCLIVFQLIFGYIKMTENLKCRGRIL